MKGLGFFMFSPKSERLKAVVKYACLILGAAILSFGLYNVHSQSNITEGGVLGMTLFLHHWLGISPAISGFVMDVSCYILGYKYLGKQFAKYAIVASSSFAFSYSVYEQFPPILPDLSSHPVFAAIVGGCFVGLGVGLVVRVGGASGGDDALAMVISKKTGLPIEKAYLFTDLVVLAMSLSYIPIIKILCSLITVTISSLIIGRIHGKVGNKAKT
ncbi:MAG: YitT family protein [Oscillospiraceae bacterium]